MEGATSVVPRARVDRISTMLATEPQDQRQPHRSFAWHTPRAFQRHAKAAGESVGDAAEDPPAEQSERSRGARHA